MAPIGHETSFELSRQERLAGVPSPRNQNDRRPMAVLLSAIFNRDLALDPRKVAPSGFFAEKFLVVMDQLCNDPAACDVVFIHQDEAARCLERGR